MSIGRVRAASARDACALAEVLVDSRRWSYRDIYPDDVADHMEVNDLSSGFERWLSESHPEAAVLVAEQADRIVGYAYVRPSEDDATGIAELDSLYVTEDVAGTGVAGNLMDAVMEHARGRGDTTIILWVRQENARARRFYEKTGFRLDGAERRRQHDVLPTELHELRYGLSL
jgi:GNAT superfamily N-acetyltransferase